MIGEAYGSAWPRNRTSCLATSHPSRSATSKASPPACRSPRRARPWRRQRRQGGRSRPGRMPRISRRRTASPPPASKLADQEKFKREEHPFDAYRRLKEQAANNEPPKPADNFRWRYYGLFYVRAGAGLLHVPAADPERHPQALAVRRPGRSRRALRRRLFARHHARQSADPRDRSRRTRWR